MNAKEMFEALGYKKEMVNSAINFVRCKYGITKRINFYDSKQYYVALDGYTYNDSSGGTDVKEYLAITQQMKELGWIEE